MGIGMRCCGEVYGTGGIWIGKKRFNTECTEREGRSPRRRGRSELRPYRVVSGYADVFAQVDVLNGVEELHAVGHGALEGFAAADEAGASGALVDYGGGYSVFEIVSAGSAAGIDEAGSAHEAVGDLIAG